MSSTSLLVSLGSAHRWKLRNNYFLEIPKIWAAGFFSDKPVVTLGCDQSDVQTTAIEQISTSLELPRVSREAVSSCMALNKHCVSKNIPVHKFRQLDKFRQIRQVRPELLS